MLVHVGADVVGCVFHDHLVAKLGFQEGPQVMNLLPALSKKLGCLHGHGLK